MRLRFWRFARFHRQKHCEPPPRKALLQALSARRFHLSHTKASRRTAGATTGTPEAIASSGAMPNGSRGFGCTKTSAVGVKDLLDFSLSRCPSMFYLAIRRLFRLLLRSQSAFGPAPAIKRRKSFSVSFARIFIISGKSRYFFRAKFVPRKAKSWRQPANSSFLQNCFAEFYYRARNSKVSLSTPH